jgi:hypothetical protein
MAKPAVLLETIFKKSATMYSTSTFSFVNLIWIPDKTVEVYLLAFILGEKYSLFDNFIL